MNDKVAFFNKVKPWLPNLKNYITAQLKRAERNGLIPKNMYVASDISDEILVDIYEREKDIIHDAKKIKARAFALAQQKIEERIQKESIREREIPLGKILDNELRFMDESFTTDGDGDLMPVEELDDISYHQDDYKPQIFLASDDTRREIYRTLGISEEKTPDETEETHIERFVLNLPKESRNIFELKTYGLLSEKEIADVLSVEVSQVENVLVSLQKAYHRFVQKA